MASSQDNIVNRIIAASLGIMLALTLGASTAGAQACPYPGTRALFIIDGQFDPGGSGTLVVGGADDNESIAGTINSAPIPVTDVADASGVFNFGPFGVPADFELNALHAITFSTGETLSFCVNSVGDVTSCNRIGGGGGPGAGGTGAGSSGGGSPLARTGADYIDDLLRGGIAAIGAGALLVLWHRRRLASA